jgi:hypothetical protein
VASQIHLTDDLIGKDYRIIDGQVSVKVSLKDAVSSIGQYHGPETDTQFATPDPRPHGRAVGTQWVKQRDRVWGPFPEIEG